MTCVSCGIRQISATCRCRLRLLSIPADMSDGERSTPKVAQHNGAVLLCGGVLASGRIRPWLIAKKRT
jgi:hypothetical protein